MKKSYMIILAIVVMCLSLSSSFLTFADVNENSTKDSKLDERQRYTFSRDEYHYGYEDIRGQKFSCEGFWIDGEDVYLLDTLNSRVLKKDRKQTLEYTFDNINYAKDLAFFDSHYYILDAFNHKSAICVFDSEMKFLYRLEFTTKVDGDMLDYFFIDNKGNLSVLCLGTGVYYSIVNNEIITVKETLKKSIKNELLTYSDGNNSWEIEFDNMFVRPICVDDGTFYYFRTTMVSVPGAIDGENTIEAIDANGNIIGADLYEQNENSFIPNKIFQFVNGKMFAMTVNDKEVSIYEVVLDHEFESQIDTIESKYLDASENQMTRSTIFANTTRSEATSRANLMIYTPWTLRTVNVTIPSNLSSYVVLPDFVLTASQTSFFIANGYTSISGTPYCWGGFYSQFTDYSGSQYDFVNNINAGKIAGNVTSSYGTYVPGTCGVDCSGYVSVVYGLTSKKGTYDLQNGLDVVSSSSDLVGMDCIVKGGYHTCLFYLWVDQSIGKMVILESNNPSDNYDAVLYRTKYYNDYSSAGYVLRTGW